jgi:hypothetical protein
MVTVLIEMARAANVRVFFFGAVSRPILGIAIS